MATIIKWLRYACWLTAQRSCAAAQICLRYLTQQDLIVIPKTSRAERLKENFDIFDFKLAPAEIKAIASGARLPLNVLVRPGLPPAAVLESLGVRRLSAGAYLAEAALRQVATLAAGFVRTGVSDPLIEAAMPYAEINALMTGAA